MFHCDAKGAWVDIGAKAAAVCPGTESSLMVVRNVSTSRLPPSTGKSPAPPLTYPNG